MKTKTVNIYTFEELSKEAKEKAISMYIQNNDYYFLSDILEERLQELLKENSIEDLNDTSKAGTKKTRVYYSLLCYQGDGAMFEGSFLFKFKDIEYIASVKHSGHYYHYNSKNIDITRNDNEDIEENYTDIEKYFNNIYIDICKQLEKEGYSFIENEDNEDNEDNIKENFEQNNYYFLENGDMTME